MTELSVCERHLLMKAMIVRRVPNVVWIKSQLLMEALQADYELVRSKTPEYYYAEWNWWISREVDECIEQELISDGINKKTGKGPTNHGFTRTSLGNTYLRTLEPRLAEALDFMPMSDVGVLDFLSLI